MAVTRIQNGVSVAKCRFQVLEARLRCGHTLLRVLVLTATLGGRWVQVGANRFEQMDSSPGCTGYSESSDERHAPRGVVYTRRALDRRDVTGPQ